MKNSHTLFEFIPRARVQLVDGSSSSH